MLHKTRGIVLHSFNYNDSYVIVQVYTEEFGRVSYLTARSKGKKNRVAHSFFYALAVLDLEVEHQNLREIQRLKEVKICWPPSSLLIDPVKSTIGIFLAELIAKLIKDVQPNRMLFDFVFQSIQVLDLTEKGYANFHLVFMIHFCRFLGFYPDSTGYNKGMFFDLQNGIFVSYKPSHPYFLNPDDSFVFNLLLRMTYENMHTFRFSRHERKAIIGRILEYYRLHLSDFPDLNSLEVLHAVFG